MVGSKRKSIRIAIYCCTSEHVAQINKASNLIGGKMFEQRQKKKMFLKNVFKQTTPPVIFYRDTNQKCLSSIGILHILEN